MRSCRAFVDGQKDISTSVASGLCTAVEYRYRQPSSRVSQCHLQHHACPLHVAATVMLDSDVGMRHIPVDETPEPCARAERASLPTGQGAMRE